MVVGHHGGHHALAVVGDSVHAAAGNVSDEAVAAQARVGVLRGQSVERRRLLAQAGRGRTPKKGNVRDLIVTSAITRVDLRTHT